ncbi:MAG: hypothetical protein ABJA37_03625 [Ferruginibacter sp.]
MKKRLLSVIFFLFFSLCMFAQNFSGQWKGVFFDKSVSFVGFGGNQCDYVLDLECKGKAVTGYSYTYFTDGGKRYYTICKLEGFLDKKKKYIEVKETERTKTNVPAEVRNCFQIHQLTYTKIDNEETLQGTWIPVPNQGGNCGFGVTTLSRRNLQNSFPNFNKNAAKTIPQKKSATKDKPALVKNFTKSAPVITHTQTAKEPVLIPNRDSFLRQEPVLKDVPKKITAPSFNFEKRNNTLLKTIEVDNESIKVDLYDNGEIDGDSISLFYNNKLLLSHKRLSDKAITLNIPVAQDDGVNELVMYAENLGSIPPNTALMVVTDGSKRYEIRITSDLQKSGAIRFLHKKVNPN